jgi:hypothetical protein
MLTVASVTPLSYYLFPFLCGFFNLSQGYLILLAPVVLFGSVLTGIAVAELANSLNTASRVGLGLIAWVATVALFFAFPAGAKTWTMGFSANLRLTKNPKQLQQWAVGILERYEAGQLSTSTNAPYWAAGRVELNASEVPPHIAGLWFDKPSIGLAAVTPDGGITAPSEAEASGTPEQQQNRCVAFSWYLTGVLVGRPGFRSTWNPWYIREITPGVYVYCGMK